MDKQSVIQQLGAEDANKRYYFQSVLMPDSDEFQFEFLDSKPVDHDHNVNEDWINKATSADVNTVLSPNGTVLIVPGSGRNKDLNAYLADDKIDNIEKEAFLQRVINTARTLSKKSNKPIYVTTDGTGVDWLHVRIEEYPKYLKKGNFSKPEKSPEYADKICSGLFFGLEPPEIDDGKCLIPVVNHNENTIIYSGNKILVNYSGNYSHYYFNELGFAYSTENHQNERMWESITFPKAYFLSTESKRELAMYDFINGVAAKKYYIVATQEIDESSIYAFKYSIEVEESYNVIKRTSHLVPKALYMPTEKYFSGVPQGIRNVGVSCYINAALQMYRNYRIITGSNASPEIEKNNELKVFLDDFVTKTDSIISPAADDLKQLFYYKSGEMGDSAEVIGIFDMNVLNISANDLLVNTELKDKAIERLARDYFKQKYKEVAKSDHIALSVAHHIMSTEDKYKTLASYPPHTYKILTNNYTHLNNIQRNIPREIKLGDRTFTLTSVVFHRGNNLNSGHYMAACKWFNKWYLHDDHDVRDYNDQFNKMKQFSDGPPYAVLLLYIVKKV